MLGNHRVIVAEERFHYFVISRVYFLGRRDELIGKFLKLLAISGIVVIIATVGARYKGTGTADKFGRVVFKAAEKGCKLCPFGAVGAARGNGILL